MFDKYIFKVCGVVFICVLMIMAFGNMKEASPPTFSVDLKTIPYNTKIDIEDVHSVPKQIIKVEKNDLDNTRDRVYIFPRGPKVMYLYRTHTLPSGIEVPDVSFARIEDRCDKLAPPFCSFDFVISEDPNYPSAIHITDLWVEDR